MRVLITGGAGFIGAHLVRAYLARGDEVTVVDTLSTGKRERVPLQADFQLLDVRSPLLQRLLEIGHFDMLNHHAAQVSVRQSVERPSMDADVNVLGSLRLMEAAVHARVPTIILASSCGVYGDPLSLPIRETAPLHPLSPYAVAKRCVELYAEALSAIHGISVICLRYANVYGPGAEAHTEAGVIPLFVQSLQLGTPPHIFGDGAATRDYIYVDDIVRANLAAERLRGFHILNLGTGVETSVNQLCALLRERIDGPEPRHGTPRAGEVQRSALDSSRAGDLLGWRAEISLAQGIHHLLANRGVPD